MKYAPLTSGYNGLVGGYHAVGCEPMFPGLGALTLLTLVKPPLTEKEIVAQGKGVKQLRHRLGLRKWCQLYAGEMEQARILVDVLRRQN